VQNRMAATAFVFVAGVAGCAQTQTTPLKAARVTIDGATRTTRPSVQPNAVVPHHRHP
jgi:hypothetical protein